MDSSTYYSGRTRRRGSGLCPERPGTDSRKGEAKDAIPSIHLASLGGTSSGGNSINDQSWVAGYSRLPDRNRHATLWRNSSLTDLGTLGGPNSSVTWNVKNTAGIIVGISQTLTPEPLGESWSSAAFYRSALQRRLYQPRVRLAKQPDEGTAQFPWRK